MLLKIVTAYLALCLLIFLYLLKDVFKRDPKFGPNYLSGMYWLMVFITAMPVVNLYMLTMIIAGIPNSIERWARRTTFNAKYDRNRAVHKVDVGMAYTMLGVTRCTDCGHLETAESVHKWKMPNGMLRCTSCGETQHDMPGWHRKHNWVTIINREVEKMSTKDCFRFVFSHYLRFDKK